MTPAKWTNITFIFAVFSIALLIFTLPLTINRDEKLDKGVAQAEQAQAAISESCQILRDVIRIFRVAAVKNGTYTPKADAVFSEVFARLDRCQNRK